VEQLASGNGGGRRSITNIPPVRSGMSLTNPKIPQLAAASARCSILVQGLQWSIAWYPPTDLVWFDRAEGHRGGDRDDSSTPCLAQHCVQQRKRRQSGSQEEGQKYRKINYSCYKTSSNRRRSITSHWDSRRDRQVHRQRLCYALAESD